MLEAILPTDAARLMREGGAGLVFSGALRSCAMATMLRYMPWNKTAAAVGSPVKA